MARAFQALLKFREKVSNQSINILFYFFGMKCLFFADWNAYLERI
jgi:hypothetical protein